MVQQRIELQGERPQYKQVSSAISGASLGNARAFKMAEVTLGASTGNTYVFAWQNPEDNIIIVTEVIIYISSAAGAAATLDCAVVADATSNSDTIFDALNLNTTGAFSSQIIADTGTSGTEVPRVVAAKGGATDWITGYESANASYASLVGFAYIFYTEV